eukprot:881387-Rhodomonas_salina.1
MSAALCWHLQRTVPLLRTRVCASQEHVSKKAVGMPYLCRLCAFCTNPAAVCVSFGCGEWGTAGERA